MSEITTRATLVTKFAELTAALPAVQRAASQSRIDEGIARETMREVWRTHGQYSDQGRSAEAAMFAAEATRQEAEAAESSVAAMQQDALDKLIALPSGKVWQQAETKASALLNKLQESGGEQFETTLAAVQSLRSAITASITPEQLIAACNTNQATVEAAGQ